MRMSKTAGLSLFAAAAIAIFALCFCLPNWQRGVYAYFSFDSFEDDNLGEMDYTLYLPPGYRRSTKLPLIVFLHGYERRVDKEHWELDDGLGPVIASRIRSGNPVEFFALFPKSDSGSWHATSGGGQLLMKLVGYVMDRYPVDADRVYLTGVSEGGSGVWSLATKYPDRWAAIAPIGGCPELASAAAVCGIPCWCFQGGLERQVDLVQVQQMMDALRKAGAQPRYTQYPGRRHNISIAPFTDAQFFDWLLAQRRRPSGG
jgi:predicted peptidase